MGRLTTSLDPRTQRVFAYLDNELYGKERTAFVVALRADGKLAQELRAWQGLFDALFALPTFQPSEQFQVSVMAALRAQPSLAHRVLSWLLGETPRPKAETLSQLIEGSLSPRQARALTAFLAEDAGAQRAVLESQQLDATLAAVPMLSPNSRFSERVMARVTIPPLASPSFMTRVLGRLTGLWPDRRQRLAVASGIACGPTAVVATLAYMVFSNPLTTPTSLATYLWSKGSEQVAGLFTESLRGALDTGMVRGLYGILDGLSLSGPAVGGALGILTVMTVMASWVLYKHLIRIPLTDQRHAAI